MGSKYIPSSTGLIKIREALITRTSNHAGAIKALQFNPFRPGLLATSGAKGEVCSHESHPFSV